MSSALAVDLGKTGCRGALWTEAGRFDAEGPGTAGLAALMGAVTADRAILEEARQLLQQAGLSCVTMVAIGAAGALSAPAAAQELAERLLVALPASRLAITSDAVTSHAGALAGQPGVMLADGAFTRVDGGGPWLGDDGSGAWLGLAGLRCILARRRRTRPSDLVARRSFGTLWSHR
jgi:N-acetylglucosamine kinase-like BadF-type ATPase